MKLYLTAVSMFCEENEIELYRTLGFTVEKMDEYPNCYNLFPETIEIELNSLEELFALQKKIIHEIIISCDNNLNIYNNNRE